MFIPILYIIFILIEYNLCNRLFPALDQVSLREDWGREYRIGKSLQNEREYEDSCKAFRRAELLLQSSKFSITDIMLKYNQMVSSFYSKKYLATIEFGEYILEALSAKKHDLKKIPYYQDVLVALYFSYKEVGLNKKTHAILSELEFINKQLVNNIEFVNNLCSSSHLNVMKELQNIQRSSAKTICSKFKVAESNKYIKIIFPYYGYYHNGNKALSILSFLVDLITVYCIFESINNNNSSSVSFVFLGISCHLLTSWHMKNLEDFYISKLVQEAIQIILKERNCTQLDFVRSGT